MSYAQSRFMYGGRSYNFPSRFFQDLGYNPYGTRDKNGDGLNDYDADDDFGEDDSYADGWDSDPFPDDGPIYE